jgi:hypothetical protein
MRAMADCHRETLVSRSVSQLHDSPCISVDDAYAFLQSTLSCTSRADVDAAVRALLQSECRERLISTRYKLRVGWPNEQCAEPALVLRNGEQTVILRVDAAK